MPSWILDLTANSSEFNRPGTGKEGESVHKDLSLPPSLHTANHSKIFAIQNTHTHTHTGSTSAGQWCLIFLATIN